jgi:hypothetical protein
MNIIHFTHGAADPLESSGAEGAHFLPLADGSGDTLTSVRSRIPNESRAPHGRAMLVTQGLREARTARRNAAGKSFCAFAIQHRAESRWFAYPWQTPLVAATSPCFARSAIQLEIWTCSQGVMHITDTGSGHQRHASDRPTPVPVGVIEPRAAEM